MDIGQPNPLNVSLNVSQGISGETSQTSALQQLNSMSQESRLEIMSSTTDTGSVNQTSSDSHVNEAMQKVELSVLKHQLTTALAQIKDLKVNG